MGGPFGPPFSSMEKRCMSTDTLCIDATTRYQSLETCF